MAADDRAGVVLVNVDEAVLEALVAVATSDAAAEEVTPPLTAGDSWTEVRVAWLRAFHRDRRAGLAGPRGESTWALVAAGDVIGSVRLKRTESADVLETGIWLARRVRGQGFGTAAAAAVAERAAALGAVEVRADTTSTNVRALALLRRAGFAVRSTDGGGSVQAVLATRPPTAAVAPVPT